MIYHPALTYYARAYGIDQVAIEQDGKEPSAKRLARLIEQARRDSIASCLPEPVPASTVEVITKISGRRASGSIRWPRMSSAILPILRIS